MNETARTNSAAASDGRSSRWAAHRATRRRALIKAARRAVHRLGHGASMEDIAMAAETSKSVYYRYFGDKAGLQQAMGEVVIGQMQAHLLDAARQAATPRDGLRAMVSAYLQMAETSPNVYTFVTRIGPADALTTAEDPSSETLTHFFDAISAMLARPMQRYLSSAGEASRIAPPSLQFWPRAAIGMVRAAGELWLATPPGPYRPTEEQMTDQLTGWLCEGITPQVSPAAAGQPAEHTAQRTIPDPKDNQ
ncbi:TetR/AcrR family transcriptional regulator [Arthrobacter sp. H5]|uniref:TetR/AcrR family transcriptional regulator n=1 Tax=Arthrobacter sp. H5 TaxID=1267973 RepID=UPI0004B23CF6|nr:TetR/AcrR family transcriptional regulator [Arthrobacter sp. H5]